MYPQHIPHASPAYFPCIPHVFSESRIFPHPQVALSPRSMCSQPAWLTMGSAALRRCCPCCRSPNARTCCTSWPAWLDPLHPRGGSCRRQSCRCVCCCPPPRSSQLATVGFAGRGRAAPRKLQDILLQSWGPEENSFLLQTPAVSACCLLQDP
jgi:hypothetical protein